VSEYEIQPDKKLSSEYEFQRDYIYLELELEL